MDEAGIIASIESVSAAVRMGAMRRAREDDALIEAIESVSRFIDARRVELVRRDVATIQRLLLPHADPLRAEWDLFEAFGADETRYTQLLAAMLSGRCGPRARRVTWSALGRTIIGALPPSEATRRVARAWEAATVDPTVEVHAELSACIDYRVPGGERRIAKTVRPDITIESAGLFAIVELKLTGTWNGLPDAPEQAHAYAALGARRCPPSSVLSLVSIATHRLPAAAGFLNLTWREYAMQIRRELRGDALELGDSALVPVLAFLVALERQQLGLELPLAALHGSAESVSTRDFSQLGAIAHYLETTHDRE